MLSLTCRVVSIILPPTDALKHPSIVVKSRDILSEIVLVASISIDVQSERVNNQSQVGDSRSKMLRRLVCCVVALSGIVLGAG